MQPLRRQFLVRAACVLGASTVPVQSASGVTAPTTECVSDETARFQSAVRSGDTLTIENQLEKTPNLLYSRDQQGVSSFMLACLSGQPKAAEVLLSKGLVMDLHEAAASGKADRVAELLKIDLPSINARDIQGYTAMHRAAALGQGAVVWLLLSKGAQLDAKNPLAKNITPMHAALWNPDTTGATAAASPLLSNGVDPRAKLTDGRTPLHTTAEMGHVALSALLLRKGADPDVKDEQGNTSLQVALAHGHTEVASLLRDPKRAGRDDYSSRYLSTRKGEGIKRDDLNGLPQNWINSFVVTAHFDFDRTKQSYAKCPDLLMTRCVFDELAVEGAAHMGREDTADFLLERGSPYSTATATMFGDRQKVKELLLEEPRRIAERGPHDFPLILYTAFGREHLDIAEFLLGAGANVNDNSNGLTTLHVCAKKGYIDLAALMIERGAVKNMRSTFDEFKTPLELAQGATSKNDKLIALLKG